jgi:hypothetical protein
MRRLAGEQPITICSIHLCRNIRPMRRVLRRVVWPVTQRVNTDHDSDHPVQDVQGRKLAHTEEIETTSK